MMGNKKRHMIIIWLTDANGVPAGLFVGTERDALRYSLGWSRYGTAMSFGDTIPAEPETP